MIHNKLRYGYVLALCAVAVFFFFMVFLEQRNYQDIWILDGIVVPTAMFIFVFLVAEVFVQENKKAVILAAFLLAAINIIPGLKYNLFSGAHDAPAHFRFTNEIVSLGHIPENEHISEMYNGNSGMHVFMACVSIISGISVNEIFRFITPALAGLVPFLVYFVTKDILEKTVQRYVIISSSFPIVLRYITYGTSLAILPYFLFIVVFIYLIFTKTQKITFWLIFVIMGFNVIVSHAITSLFMALVLVGMLTVLLLLRSGGKQFLGYIRAGSFIVPSILYIVLLFTWWSSASSFNVNTLAAMIRSILFGQTEPTIPSRFYDILLLPQLQVLAVSHLRDAIIGILSLCGLLVFLRKLRRNEVPDRTKSFYLLLVVLLVNFVLFLFLKVVIGVYLFREYARFIVYAMPLCIFLIGLMLWRFDRFLNSISARPIIGNLAFASFLFVLVSSCLIQSYLYQPLIPRANVLSKDLPENEYLVNLGVVNTIYQIEMISFAERHFYNGSIASDVTTRFQVHGFSNPSFFSRHIWNSPLEPSQNRKWDLFLLHTVKAGPLSEPAEYRTRERIENLRLEAGNVIYDNGESFIIHAHSP